MTDSQQALGARCTCTGGPYTHGPEGLSRVLSEIAAVQEAEKQNPQPTEGDADDE